MHFNELMCVHILRALVKSMLLPNWVLLFVNISVDLRLDTATAHTHPCSKFEYSMFSNIDFPLNI